MYTSLVNTVHSSTIDGATHGKVWEILNPDNVKLPNGLVKITLVDWEQTILKEIEIYKPIKFKLIWGYYVYILWWALSIHVVL